MGRSVSYSGKLNGCSSHFLCYSSTRIYSAPSFKTSTTSISKKTKENKKGEIKDE